LLLNAACMGLVTSNSLQWLKSLYRSALYHSCILPYLSLHLSP